MVGRLARSLRKRLLPLRRALFGDRYVATVGGREIVIDLADRGFTARYYYRAQKSKTLDAFRALLRPGMTVVDVGANVGIFTLEANDAVGPGGRVIAFEPDPHNRALLEENVARNDARSVTVESCAISDARGEVTLHRSRYNFGDHRIYDAGGDTDFHRGGQRSTVTVPTRKLDDYIAEHGLEVDVVKCDIQGAERRMWNGMRTLVATRPELLVVMEFWPQGLKACGDDPGEFLAEIAAAGFRVERITRAGREATPPSRLLAELADGSHANVVLTR